MDEVVQVDSLVSRFGAQIVHDHLSFTVRRGDVIALIGGSGTGKSVLLREILGLARPTAGQIKLLGTDIRACSGGQLGALRRRLGVLFQDGALFSSLTVGENVAIPLRESTSLPQSVIAPLVGFKLALVGLPPGAGAKSPAQLSGGMRKRVGLARALALEPELLFLDEPTSGLDPVSAREFGRMLRVLADSLGLTVVFVTHDVDLLADVATRVLALAAGKIIADGPAPEVKRSADPWLHAYFSGHA
jgi:phospholipid/cholesterol/gamma-HCH transport system ATP-binding protein